MDWRRVDSVEKRGGWTLFNRVRVDSPEGWTHWPLATGNWQLAKGRRESITEGLKLDPFGRSFGWTSVVGPLIRPSLQKEDLGETKSKDRR
jgi:hypothetical protein